MSHMNLLCATRPVAMIRQRCLSQLLSVALSLGTFWALISPVECSAQSPFGYGLGLIVDEVRVEGTRRSEPDSVKRVLRQKEGAPLSPRMLREDIKRIYKLGLYRDVQADLKEVEDRFVLRYIVSEKRSVKQVRYEGNDELSEEDIEEVVDIKPYSILDLPEVNRNAEKIKELYIEKGFFWRR